MAVERSSLNGIVQAPDRRGRPLKEDDEAAELHVLQASGRLASHEHSRLPGCRPACRAECDVHRPTV